MTDSISNKEAIDMMQRCVEDITSLRKQVSELQPRAEAFEALKVVIGMIRTGSMGMSEDICWTLNKRIRELQEANKKESR